MSGTATDSLAAIAQPDNERTAERPGNRRGFGGTVRRLFTPSPRSTNSPWSHLHSCRSTGDAPAGSYWSTCSTCGRLTWSGIQPPATADRYHGWTVGAESIKAPSVGTEKVQRRSVQSAIQATDRRIEWTVSSEHDSAPSVGTTQVSWSDILPSHGGTRAGHPYYHPIVDASEAPIVAPSSERYLYTHSAIGEHVTWSRSSEHTTAAPVAVTQLARQPVRTDGSGLSSSTAGTAEPGSSELFWRAEWLKSRQAQVPQRPSSGEIIVRQDPSVPSTVGR